jgi:hypothetical protein
MRKPGKIQSSFETQPAKLFKIRKIILTRKVRYALFHFKCFILK